MSRTVIILLAFIGYALAAPKDGSRIIGGEQASIQQYPFMANMIFNVRDTIFQSYCGGTLLTVNSIVSAAHCFIHDAIYEWRARFGSDQANSGGVVHTISNINFHPNYDDTWLLNDIAIVKLLRFVQLSSNIGVARIAGPQYTLNDGTCVYAAGFGNVQFEGPSSPVLLHVGVHVINHTLCMDRYISLKSQPDFEGLYDINEDNLCTGILDVGGKDACTGDSGGPVIHQGDVLVGITSWGFECANGTYPGVNVRVSSYTSWITSNT